MTIARAGLRVWIAISIVVILAFGLVAYAAPANASNWGTCQKSVGIQRLQCHGNLLHNSSHALQWKTNPGTLHDRITGSDPYGTVSISTATASNISGYHVGRYFICSDAWAGACH